MILVGSVGFVLCWLLGFWLLWHIPTPGESRRRRAGKHGGALAIPESTALSVSVVIPARNEERNLPCLLQSLVAQTRRADEIIVVDDHSEDSTATVAARLGARVVTAPVLPSGWMGKPWACWVGARAATGHLIVFLDADTTLSPEGLENLVAEYRVRGGMLSVQPYHVTLRAYERIAAALNITLMMAMNVFTPLGERVAPSGAFGPCVVCSRADYFATGGHKAVRSAILEDSFLGRVFSRAGLPVRCLGGRDTISFRMYPEGLGQVIEGWTKTLGSGSAGTSLVTFFLVLIWCTGAVASIAAPIVVALDPVARQSLTLWLASLAAYGAYAVQLRWMLRRIGDFGEWPAPAFPALAVFYAGMATHAVLLMFGGKSVRWKGRRLATKPFREVGFGSDAKLGR